MTESRAPFGLVVLGAIVEAPHLIPALLGMLGERLGRLLDRVTGA